MNYREISNTGVNVSQIGFGTVKIGRDKSVKYPTAFMIPDDKQALDLLSACQELGINLLDTAPAYGNSEQRLGQLLKPSKRHKWIISTKAGEEFDSQSGTSQFDFSKQAITQSVERSLTRLNTDYLDIVMIHSSGEDLKILQQDQALQTLAELKQEGKIRAIGMSTKSVLGGIAALEQSDCAMITYNLADQSELEVIEYAGRCNKAIFVKKAFASGHLNRQSRLDPIQESLAFIFAQASVSSAVIGTINQQNLRANVKKYLQLVAK
jgi:aryl-alcohol dehydrogenase-like predicted oxidoreductase